jgi:hypothetical protein
VIALNWIYETRKQIRFQAHLRAHGQGPVEHAAPGPRRLQALLSGAWLE